jgi:hypothetical protein
MKKSLLLFLVLFYINAFASGTTEKICHEKEVKGKKTNVCKSVKVHKQVEDDTKVPTKKK